MIENTDFSGDIDRKTIKRLNLEKHDTIYLTKLIFGDYFFVFIKERLG